MSGPIDTKSGGVPEKPIHPIDRDKDIESLTELKKNIQQLEKTVDTLASASKKSGVTKDLDSIPNHDLEADLGELEKKAEVSRDAFLKFRNLKTTDSGTGMLSWFSEGDMAAIRAALLNIMDQLHKLKELYTAQILEKLKSIPEQAKLRGELEKSAADKEATAQIIQGVVSLVSAVTTGAQAVGQFVFSKKAVDGAMEKEKADIIKEKPLEMPAQVNKPPSADPNKKNYTTDELLEALKSKPYEPQPAAAAGANPQVAQAQQPKTWQQEAQELLNHPDHKDLKAQLEKLEEFKSTEFSRSLQLNDAFNKRFEVPSKMVEQLGNMSGQLGSSFVKREEAEVRREKEVVAGQQQFDAKILDSRVRDADTATQDEAKLLDKLEQMQKGKQQTGASLYGSRSG